jgi:hypothetical protein
MPANGADLVLALDEFEFVAILTNIMTTKTLAHRVLLVVSGLTFIIVGCSDQGAVKNDAPKANASTAKAPPLVSGRDDGTGTLPPGHPPVGAGAKTASGLPPVPEGAGTGDAALAWTAPATWIAEKPASSMRRAQYKVPGGAGDGECVVFYFGPGQGGDPMSNAQRWAEQFTLADGSPAQSAMKTSEIVVGGLKVVIVEVAGTYKGGMTMTMEPAAPKPGYRLLGAIAPGPDANWYFKFTGPDATVKDQRAAFMSMVSSLKHGAS